MCLILQYGAQNPKGVRGNSPKRPRDQFFRGGVRAPIGPIKRDSTRRRVEPGFAPELLQAARALGIPARKLAAMLEQQRSAL